MDARRGIFFGGFFSELGKINDFMGKKCQNEWKNLIFFYFPN